MNVKEWLNRNYKQAKELETKIACLETMINICSKPKNDGFFRGHDENSTEISFIRWSELKDEIERLNAEVNAVDRETDEVLRCLDDSDEYRVLYCRYVRRMEWRDIQKCFGYPQSSMFRAHTNGINHVKDIVKSKFDYYF